MPGSCRGTVPVSTGGGATSAWEQLRSASAAAAAGSGSRGREVSDIDEAGVEAAIAWLAERAGPP